MHTEESERPTGPGVCSAGNGGLHNPLATLCFWPWAVVGGLLYVYWKCSYIRFFAEAGRRILSAPANSVLHTFTDKIAVLIWLTQRQLQRWCYFRGLLSATKQARVPGTFALHQTVQLGAWPPASDGVRCATCWWGVEVAVPSFDVLFAVLLFQVLHFLSRSLRRLGGKIHDKRPAIWTRAVWKSRWYVGCGSANVCRRTTVDLRKNAKPLPSDAVHFSGREQLICDKAVG